MNLDHVLGQLVCKFSLPAFQVDDGPQNKLMLGHGSNIAIHPRGHTASNVRVTSFQNKTNDQVLLLKFDDNMIIQRLD